MLRVAVARKKKKPTEVRGNASKNALQNGAAPCDTPTYASRLAAEGDAPRFRLSVEWLNDCNPKHLHANILKAFVAIDIERMRRFARKTREYKRAYRIYHVPGGDVKDHAAIDKFVKTPKRHRASLDQEYAFVNAT